jgi:hypothetical protein
VALFWLTLLGRCYRSFCCWTMANRARPTELCMFDSEFYCVWNCADSCSIMFLYLNIDSWFALTLLVMAFSCQICMIEVLLW